mmetsp:Transcript_26274/g.43371  ORF Transcript_26274/g.43371 Transcript_26274/m.43371 type:complete len:188 (+) Transcript_26274:86-649(+)
MYPLAVLVALVLAVSVANAFQTTTGSSMGEKTVVVSRRDFLAGAGVAATGLVLAPHSVLADMSLPAAKQLYFRYVPRLNDGKSFYANDLKKAIDDQDWEAVKKTFVKEVIVQPTSKKYNPPATSKWDRDLTTPMTIWSSTFAEKGVSKKTTALQEQEQLLETALAKIERVAGGGGGGGGGAVPAMAA